MKKNKEWLKNELEKVIKDVESDDTSFAGKEDYDEGYIDGIRDVQSIVDQLDEPETLSQEWIDEHTAGADTIAHYSEEDVPVVMVSDLKGLLIANEPNPSNSMGLELPVIPAHVAEWIETIRELNGDMVGTLIDGNYNMEVGDWLFLDDDTVNVVNSEKLMSAWRNGYTVEVKKYAVAVDHDNGDWTYASDGRNIFKTRFKSDATQLAKLLGGRVIRYEEGE